MAGERAARARGPRASAPPSPRRLAGRLEVGVRRQAGERRGDRLVGAPRRASSCATRIRAPALAPGDRLDERPRQRGVVEQPQPREPVERLGDLLALVARPRRASARARAGSAAAAPGAAPPCPRAPDGRRRRTPTPPPHSRLRPLPGAQRGSAQLFSLRTMRLRAESPSRRRSTSSRLAGRSRTLRFLSSTSRSSIWSARVLAGRREQPAQRRPAVETVEEGALSQRHGFDLPRRRALNPDRDERLDRFERKDRARAADHHLVLGLEAEQELAQVDLARATVSFSGPLRTISSARRCDQPEAGGEEREMHAADADVEVAQRHLRRRVARRSAARSGEQRGLPSRPVRGRDDDAVVDQHSADPRLTRRSTACPRAGAPSSSSSTSSRAHGDARRPGSRTGPASRRRGPAPTPAIDCASVDSDRRARRAARGRRAPRRAAAAAVRQCASARAEVVGAEDARARTRCWPKMLLRLVRPAVEDLAGAKADALLALAAAHDERAR